MLIPPEGKIPAIWLQTCPIEARHAAIPEISGILR